MTSQYCHTATYGINGTNGTNGSYGACQSPSFWTGLYFIPNPSGIKTTITISYLRDIFDVLSSVGGILSPLLTGTGLLILYLIWGLDLGCIRFGGLAPTAGFGDYIFEKKLDVYLAERGLIIVNAKDDKKTRDLNLIDI